MSSFCNKDTSNLFNRVSFIVTSVSSKPCTLVSPQGLLPPCTLYSLIHPCVNTLYLVPLLQTFPSTRVPSFRNLRSQSLNLKRLLWTLGDFPKLGRPTFTLPPHESTHEPPPISPSFCLPPKSSLFRCRRVCCPLISSVWSTFDYTQIPTKSSLPLSPYLDSHSILFTYLPISILKCQFSHSGELNNVHSSYSLPL